MLLIFCVLQQDLCSEYVETQGCMYMYNAVSLTYPVLQSIQKG